MPESVRRSAQEILEEVVQNGRDELSRTSVALMFSGLAGGSGVHAAEGSFVIFAKGIIGGWLIALVAWMVTAAHWTIGQIAVTWLLPATLGNITGGVAIVSLLNYGQVRSGEPETVASVRRSK